MQIKDYKLVRKLFETTDAHIFVCNDQILNEKRLFFILKHKIDEFEDYLLKIKSIQHPNVLQVIDFGESDSIQFVVTEFIDSSVLKFLFKIRYFSLRKIKQLLIQLLDVYQLLETKHIYQYAFDSTSILFSKQGVFKLVLFQSELIRSIQTGEKLDNPRILPDQVGFTDDTWLNYRFYSLGVIWLESQIDQTSFDKLIQGEQHILSNQILLEHDFIFCKMCFEPNNEFNVDSFAKKIRSMSDVSKSVNQLAPNLMLLFKPILIGLSNDFRSHLIAGTKGAGKTTLLNFIANHLKQSNYHIFVHSGHFEIPRSASLLHNLLHHIIKKTVVSDLIYDEQSDHFLYYLNTEHDCSFSVQTKSIDYKTDANLLIENSIRFLNQVLIDQDLVICVDDLNELDRESIIFLNLAISQTQKMKIYLIASLAEDQIHFYQKKIADGDSELLFIDNMNLRQTQDFVKYILETDDIQTKLITNKIYTRTRGHLKSCNDILNILRKEFIRVEENTIVDQAQEILNSNIQERFAQKLEHYKKFAELIVFITLLKKPITIELLNEVFSNNHVFSEILNHLISDQILNYTEFSVHGYWVESEHNSNLILNYFDEELIKELIKQFLTNPLIKSYFDYEKAAKYLVIAKDYKLSVELYIKLANLYRYQHTFGAAAQVYRKALDLVQNHQIDLSKTIINQVTEYLADSNYQIKSYSAALHYYTLYLNDNNELQPEKIFELQLARIRCHINMEQFENAKILIAECEESSDEQRDSTLTIKLLREKANLFLVAGLYDEAITIYERLINNEESLNKDFYQVITETIDVYKELERYKILVDFIQTALRKSQFLMSYELSRLRLQLALIHYNQSHFEEAENVLKQCINQANQAFDMRTLSEAKSYLGAIRIQQGESELAINEFNEAYEILSKIGLMEKAAHLKSAIAVIYKDTGKISNAIMAEEEAIDLFERQQNTKELVYSYTNLGHIYYHVFDFERAKLLFNKALGLAESTEFIEGICHANLFLSAIYSSVNQFDKADQTLAYTLNLIDMKDSINYIHYIYYKSYLDYKRGFYQDAWNQLIMCFESEAIAKNKKYNFIFSYLLGCILLRQSALDKSKQVLEKANQLALKQNNLIYQFYIINELVNIDQQLNNETNIYQQKRDNIIVDIAKNIDDPILKNIFLESNQTIAQNLTKEVDK